MNAKTKDTTVTIAGLLMFVGGISLGLGFRYGVFGLLAGSILALWRKYQISKSSSA